MAPLNLQQYDSYTLRARVAPVFIVLIPLVLGTYVWFPDAFSLHLGAATIIFSLGISALLAQLGRDFGKRKEKMLFDIWDGPPTTRFLRHRNKEFNTIQRERCHKKLRMLMSDNSVPSAEEEASNPELADTVYEACTRFLISKTRDKGKFPLLFKENVSYGFCRNLWAMRPLGISSSALGVALALGHLLRSWQNLGYVTGSEVTAVGVNVMLLVLWLLWFTSDLVRLRADAYAERLLEGSENL